MKNKLTDLCGNCLLYNDFLNTFCEMKVDEAIAEGADLNTRDRSERTPIHFAAMKGNAECLKKLLAGGADVEPLDQQGQVPTPPISEL